MITLGIDPGTIITGYGIIEKSFGKIIYLTGGVIDLSKKKFIPDKLEIIYNNIDDLIKKFSPIEFAVETAFYGKNVQSALKIGYARGVSILAALHNNLPVSEYSPREIKKSIVGNGAATKEQVQFMVKSLLNLKGKMKFDETDALAIAICHSSRITSLNGKKTNWKEFIKNNPDRVII